MPKLASEGGRVFVAAHVEPELARKLTENSQRLGISKAALIRLALHYALETPISLLREQAAGEPPPAS